MQYCAKRFHENYHHDRTTRTMTSLSADAPRLNTTSELSEYELQRMPQEVITDPCVSVAVVPRSLHSDLMCPICLSLFDKTTAVDGCIHRFCLDCIVTTFDFGYTDCPVCHQKNVVERPLRPDPHFDQLISAIYPNRDKYEEHRIVMLKQIFNKPCLECIMETVNENIKIQRHLSQQTKYKPLM